MTLNHLSRLCEQHYIIYFFALLALLTIIVLWINWKLGWPE